MSLVGEPFGNCWGTRSSATRERRQPRQEQPAAQEPTERFDPSEPFRNSCWGSSSVSAPRKSMQEKPQADTYSSGGSYSYDPREPFRSYGNI